MSIGSKIREARKSKKMTQAQLGKAIGVSGAMIGQYETGVRNPKMENLGKIAEALGVPVPYLLEVYDVPASEAQEQYAAHEAQANTDDFIELAIESVCGKKKEKLISGKYGKGIIYIFGEGENAFALEEDDYLTIISTTENLIYSLVNSLNISVEEATKRKLEYLSREEIKQFRDSYAQSPKDPAIERLDEWFRAVTPLPDEKEDK